MSTLTLLEVAFTPLKSQQSQRQVGNLEASKDNERQLEKVTPFSGFDAGYLAQAVNVMHAAVCFDVLQIPRILYTSRNRMCYKHL